MIKLLLLILYFIANSAQAAIKPSYTILDLEIINNLPFVKFNIEDQQVSLLLDTGARNAELILDKKILAKLKSIVEFERKQKSSDVQDKKYIVRKYILPKFNIGEINFYKVQIAEDSKWGLTTGGILEKQGAIGLGLFDEKAIIIDYPNKKLIVIDRLIPKDYQVSTWDEVPYKINLYGLNLLAKIDKKNKEKNFILDSGANISIIKSKSTGDNIVDKNCNIILKNGVNCGFIQTPQLSISNKNYNPVKLFIYDFNQPLADGILGYEFFADKQIYIDFGKRIMKIYSKKTRAKI